MLFGQKLFFIQKNYSVSILLLGFTLFFGFFQVYGEQTLQTNHEQKVESLLDLIESGIDANLPSIISEKVSQDFQGNAYQKSAMAGQYSAAILTIVVPVGALTKGTWITKVTHNISKIKDFPKQLAQFSNKLIHTSHEGLKLVKKDLQTIVFYTQLNTEIWISKLTPKGKFIVNPQRKLDNFNPSHYLEVEKFDDVFYKLSTNGEEFFGEITILKKVDDGEYWVRVNGAGDWLTTLKSNASFTSYFDGLTNGTITRKFSNILSIEEEAVLKFYTTNPGYQNFNKALRGEIPMTDFYTAQKNLMEQALAKMPNSSYNSSSNLLYRIENLTESQISSIYVEG